MSRHLAGAAQVSIPVEPPAGRRAGSEFEQRQRGRHPVAGCSMRRVYGRSASGIRLKPPGVNFLVLAQSMAAKPMCGESRPPRTRRDQPRRTFNDHSMLRPSPQIDRNDQREPVGPDPAEQSMRQAPQFCCSPPMVDARCDAIFRRPLRRRLAIRSRQPDNLRTPSALQIWPNDYPFNCDLDSTRRRKTFATIS